MEVAQIGQDHDVEEVSRNRQHRNCGPRSDRKVNTLTPQYHGSCSTQWLLISINWIPSLFTWNFCTPGTERTDVEGAHYSKQPIQNFIIGPIVPTASLELATILNMLMVELRFMRLTVVTKDALRFLTASL
nr:PREDICTED: uncharacterized protein LOC109043933 [Bemisia tabaci]